MKKKAIMIRVGIDSASAKRAGIDSPTEKWNAPCNPENREFVYVPDPAHPPKDPSLDGYYQNIITPALKQFGRDNNCHISLRNWVCNESAHLDPDFRSGYLSYGNTYNNKGKPLKEFCEEDGDRFVIFYNSMKRIDKPKPLEYGIIGILKVQAVKQVKDISDEAEIKRNIHTRRDPPVCTDVVVFGDPEASGRLEKYLPIGKRRCNNNYYVKDSLVDAWGGVCKKDGKKHTGWLNMSTPIWLCNAPRFFEWWEQQNPRLIHKNN
ncbi:MAG: hypothetical protein OXP71_10280 [Candidatus Poribacteria bacterium]|nr:hypothetical protein [Candidatus Poribacteria bacterium]